jgi:chemotaxis protein MotB
MKDDTPRPRVVVKKGHGGGHHGGAWKVAYADFVTTMMALFIVLWIVGQNQEARAAIAQYFRDPGAFKEGRAPSIHQQGAGILPGQPVPGQGGEGENEQSKEDRSLREAGERFQQAMVDMDLPQTLRDQVRIEVTPEGLRIEMVERDGSPFFRVGSATILPEMKPILEHLATVVDKLPNNITIEGHTDSRQYNLRLGYSNWELSTDRTNSARKVMEAAGLPPGRIDRLVGHADRVLLVPDDPMDASNRRITIMVRRMPPATPSIPAAAGMPPAIAKSP